MPVRDECVVIARCRRLPIFHGDASLALAAAEAMLDGVRESGTRVLRWWTAAPGAVLLGASQSLNAVDPAACRAEGLAVHKRAAGGTVVLADRGMLGLDVVLPAGDPLLLGDLTQSYRWLGEVWVAALAQCGITARMVPVTAARSDARAGDEASRLARLACFGGLSPYEVTIDERKCVGLAQVRRRHGALFQVAALLSWSPRRLAGLLGVSPDEQAAAGAALEQRVTALPMSNDDGSRESLIAAVEHALAEVGFDLYDDVVTAHERERSAELARDRYRPLALDGGAL